MSATPTSTNNQSASCTYKPKTGGGYCPFHVAVYSSVTTAAILIGGYLGWQQLKKRQLAAASAIEHNKPLAERSYEQKKMLDEYFLMHYGENEIGQFQKSDGRYHAFSIPNASNYGDFSQPSNFQNNSLTLSPPAFPAEALNFPKRVAEIAIHFSKLTKGAVEANNIKSFRAFDVGCAVGRTAFELAAYFEEVLGLDYSFSFVNACNELAKSSKYACSFNVPVEGVITVPATAVLDPKLDRKRCSFIQGDASNLDFAKLGQFQCVVAANLIDRLPNPAGFLNACEKLISAGGILVLTSPYTWLEQYTPQELWIGGKTDKNGNVLSTFAGLQSILGTHFNLIHNSHMPFVIRETLRKNQFTMAHCTIWQRK
jgi:putative 4-mercaptohistidine N1-methyltranferase